MGGQWRQWPCKDGAGARPHPIGRRGALLGAQLAPRQATALPNPSAQNHESDALKIPWQGCKRRAAN